MDVLWSEPRALYALWLLLPLAWLLFFAYRRRRRAAAALADARMAPRLMPAERGARPWLRGVLLLAGVAALIFAIARPRWGLFFETVTRRGADVMVLLDVSRSMLSDDVKPNRLERAKSDVRDLLKEVGGDRVGLIVFAGRAVVACPLTTDLGFFRAVLREVGPHSAPRGGTAIGDAIRTALGGLEGDDERDRALLLITDGEDHDSFPREAAALASENGVKIFTVGMGDPVEGSRVPVIDDTGNRIYLKHGGEEVWSRMDEGLLRDVALETGGAYVPARTRAYDLGEVYREHLAQLAAGEILEDRREQYHERFQLFLAIGFVCLLLRQAIRPYARVVVALLLLGLPVLADDAQEGLRLYKAGEFEQASAVFERLAKERPDDLALVFNRGAALAKLGRVDAAKVCYLDAARSADAALATRAQFNLGALEAGLAREVFGERPEQAGPDKRKEGVARLEAALQHFRAAIDLDPDHDAARHNAERILLWLDHMRRVWAEQDKQKQEEPPKEDEPKLLKLIQELRDRQRDLLEAVPDSKGQGELTLRIPELKQTIEAELADEQMKPAREGLLGMATNVEQAMATAVTSFDKGDEAQAREAQLGSFWVLDTMWTALAPFEATLKEAIQVQERNIEITKGPESERKFTSPDQLRVGNYAQGLVTKAQAALQQGQAQPQGPGQQMPVEAFEKAVENGPRIAELSVQAAGKLGAREFEQALPLEEESLKLLKEIEEKLPKQDQQNQQQDQQNQDQQEKEDQEKQDQEQQQQQGDQEKEQQPEPQELSPEQIEAMLRKAEERERDHREEKEKKARALAPAKQVERDW